MTDELDTTLVEDTLVVRKPKRKYTRRAKVITAPPEEPNVKSPPMRETTEAPTPPTKYEAWVPGADDFIDLKGKKYLPARRRVQWMRGQPVGHPDWTIDTEVVEHDRGKRISAVKVEGGYALVRANVFDETGRLIATGIKSEYSENFPDYIEKAETGALSPSLATERSQLLTLMKGLIVGVSRTPRSLRLYPGLRYQAWAVEVRRRRPRTLRYAKWRASRERLGWTRRRLSTSSISTPR
jgi:hypothetical protein